MIRKNCAGRIRQRSTLANCKYNYKISVQGNENDVEQGDRKPIVVQYNQEEKQQSKQIVSNKQQPNHTNQIKPIRQKLLNVLQPSLKREYYDGDVLRRDYDTFQQRKYGQSGRKGKQEGGHYKYSACFEEEDRIIQLDQLRIKHQSRVKQKEFVSKERSPLRVTNQFNNTTVADRRISYQSVQRKCENSEKKSSQIIRGNAKILTNNTTNTIQKQFVQAESRFCKDSATNYQHFGRRYSSSSKAHETSSWKPSIRQSHQQQAKEASTVQKLRLVSQFNDKINERIRNIISCFEDLKRTKKT